MNYYTGRSKYNGMTRKQYRRVKAKEGTNSTPGVSKCEACQATGLDKAMAKYPRAIKTMPNEYTNFNIKKDKDAQRDRGFFVELVKTLQD